METTQISKCPMARWINVIHSYSGIRFGNKRKKCSKVDCGGGHRTLNILKAIGSYTVSGRIMWYVNHISIRLFFKWHLLTSVIVNSILLKLSKRGKRNKRSNTTINPKCSVAAFRMHGRI